jgi:hypothetical protein
MDSVWKFLQDPGNRAVLGWVATGIAAVAAGVWAVLRFLLRKPPSVKATGGGVAVGRDANNATINTGGPRSDANNDPKRPSAT